MKKRLLVLVCLVVAIACAVPFAVNRYLVVAEASSARGMCVMEKTSKRVLNSQNMHDRMPMASTTKVATAITVIENTADLNKVVSIPDCAVGVEGSSIYLVKGEELKIIDLLYGLMLQSGNDAATALAVVTSGSIEGFAELMNATAKRIGANNSSFTNPHGLHNDNHYTTAYDLALISCYAMENPVFKQIVGTKSYKTTWKDRSYGRNIVNKNKILSTYEGGTGVKTGYTKRAGRCLVASSERDGMEVVAVVLNCWDMFGECRALMSNAHNQYSMRAVSGRGVELGRLACEGLSVKHVAVGSSDGYFYPLRAGESVRVDADYSVSALKKYTKIGTEVGSCKIYLDNQLLFSTKLYTIEVARSLNRSDVLVEILNESLVF